MIWTNLKNKEIKNIYYQDESGGIGFFQNERQFHLIEQGTIFFEFVVNSFFEIFIDNKKGGIIFSRIKEFEKQNLVENKIITDNLWSQISNKTITHLQLYEDYFLETNKDKTTKKIVTSSIEFVFRNGEKIFISNAGYINKEEILGLTDDFIIYKKKKVGMELNLISVKQNSN